MTTNFLNKPAPTKQHTEQGGNTYRAPARTPAPERQIGDGLPLPNPGEKPTKGGLREQSGSPDKYMTSGIERAMGAQADQMHKRRK